MKMRSKSRRRLHRRRRHIRTTTPPFPLSSAAIALIVFGVCLRIIVTANTVGIGGGWIPQRAILPNHEEGLRTFALVIQWITAGFVGLLFIQVVTEIKRPPRERAIRRARLACDLIACLLAILLALTPTLMNRVIDLLPVQDPQVVHHFEYDPSDQEWHWVPLRSQNGLRMNFYRVNDAIQVTTLTILRNQL